MEQYFFEEEKNVSASETNIMKAIWDAKEDISVPDLMDQLRVKYGKDYARTTVATFLLKLSGKGFVRTYRKGKLSYARAIRSEEEYKRKLRERHILEGFCLADAAVMLVLSVIFFFDINFI